MSLMYYFKIYKNLLLPHEHVKSNFQIKLWKLKFERECMESRIRNECTIKTKSEDELQTCISCLSIERLSTIKNQENLTDLDINGYCYYKYKSNMEKYRDCCKIMKHPIE